MNISVLNGQTLTDVRVKRLDASRPGIRIDGDDDISFITQSGNEYRMWHSQECSEIVNIEEIVGDLDHLIGSPILMAEESSNSTEQMEGRCTWTFYKLATIKGYVTIRWMGESNGNYSESVDFAQVQERRGVVN